MPMLDGRGSAACRFRDVVLMKAGGDGVDGDGLCRTDPLPLVVHRICVGENKQEMREN